MHHVVVVMARLDFQPSQHADYIADQLRRFRIGAENTLEQNPGGRTNDGDGRMMRDIAAGMSDNEIKAVSSYVAGLH